MAKGVPPKIKRYSENSARDFLEKVREGLSVIQIAREWKMSSETIYSWARIYPEFSVAFQEAQKIMPRKPKRE